MARKASPAGAGRNTGSGAGRPGAAAGSAAARPLAAARAALAAMAALLLLALPAQAQQADGERMALLIGNAAYVNAPDAQTAVRDVRSVAQALRGAGWSVTAETNLDRAAMREAIERFARDAADAEDILIYYSGHALRTGGDTYLAPVDQRADTLADVLFDGVPLELLLRVAGRAPGEAVVFLDGAQLEGFTPTAFVEPGLARIEAPEGVVVVSAAPPGQAIRRSPDRDSRFARLVVDRFLLPGAEVMAAVQEAGGPTWVTGRPDDDFVLAPAPRVREDGLENEIELAYWRTAERTGRAEDYRAYLRRYPDGIFASFARDRLDIEPGEQPGQDRQPPRVDPALEAEQGLNLSRIRVRQVQEWLRALGFDPGAADGAMGPNTRSAVREWQRSAGFDVTGYLTRQQLDRLQARGEAALEDRRLAEEETRRVAEAEDRGYWMATGARGTAAGYRAYLERYPEGLRADEARAALQQIATADADAELRKERQLFLSVRREDTPEAYREYLAEYPRGVYRAEALARLDEIEGGEREASQRTRVERIEAALDLSQEDRMSVEQRLRSLGFEPGPIDGRFDRRTRAALQNYQSSRGLGVTGYLDRPTLVGIVQETSEGDVGRQLLLDGARVIEGLIEAFGRR